MNILGQVCSCFCAAQNRLLLSEIAVNHSIASISSSSAAISSAEAALGRNNLLCAQLNQNITRITELYRGIAESQQRVEVVSQKSEAMQALLKNQVRTG